MKNKKTYLLTQEWVSAGHPDKIIDQIGNGLLDEYLKQDSNSKVGIEGLCQAGILVIGGEVNTKANVDVETIVRNIIRDIGYNKDEYGFNGNSLNILNNIVKQSPEINAMVENSEISAGDQGFAYGFATNESPSGLPLPYHLARAFGIKLRESKFAYLRPDAKTQVTVEYDINDKPIRVHNVLISTSHQEMGLDILRNDIKKNIIEKLINELSPEIQRLFDSETIYRVNPNGSFTIFGPASDCGVSGRKLVVDTGFPIVGGGNMNGKDCSKNDRYAPYYGRYIAKNMVAAGIADDVLIQLAYVIGDSNATSVYVKTTHNHTNLSNIELSNIITDNFSFKPKDIIETLKLRQPMFKPTSYDGHFGKESYIENDVEYFTWEKLDLVDKIKQIFNLK